MAKYNVVMRWKREKSQEKKRAVHGDPKTKKLKELSKHPSSLSGKRKQKLLRKLRREQKDAVEKGLVTMEDVEMTSAEVAETSSNGGKQLKLQLKKISKLQIKRLKDQARKKERKSKASAQQKVDSMVE